MSKKRQWLAMFWLYCFVMLLLLFGRSGYDPAFPYHEQLKYNLIPFRTIALYARVLDSTNPALLRQAVINLGGNVILFIPLGLGITGLWPATGQLWKVVLITAAVITAVELAQLFTLVGICDIDDLILNVFGAAIGHWLYSNLFNEKNA